ncbi:MAG: GDP-L-fucose synthase family protein [Phycisphaerae bacterium]
MDLTRERIVVTGGGGFLGQALMAELRRVGVPADRLHVPRSKEYDLTREADAARMYTDHEPTIVFHLAAEVGGIGANRENPGRFFHANMAMGLHVIEQARIAGVKKLIQLGTVCAYPKVVPVPFVEDALWDGYPEETNAPYGIAKKALLVMLQAYRRQYGFNGIYLLPANLYGPNDHFDPAVSHVIPALIRRFVEARERGESEVTIWGTGRATREFLYVDDCARGVVLAALQYDGGDPVNLGSGEEISIRDLAGKIQRLAGYDGRLVWDDNKPDGQPRRHLNTDRARRFFGFRAEIGLDEGLKRTIDWYLAHRGD